MSQTRVCPDCGAEIPADSPAGQCPKCLLKEGFRSDVSGEHSLARTAPSPASAGFQPPPIEQLASLFPQLELLELLGKGGMGAVYKARQRGLDRLVAIKILPPEIGRDPAFAERFTREARAMARLSHPHIVAIHDFGQTNGQFYFVMEFVEGANLRQVIQSKQLTPAEALAVVPQICDALQYAHDEGIVHRDIKPENILVDTKGRVKIADFGLSKLLHEDHPDVSLTGTHQVMGTLRYMAPEQLQGTKGVDHRADIYSLGVVFYELLTGQVPMGRFDPPSKKVQVDVRLDEVVLRALEQEPEKRYQQASEIKTGVQAVVSSPNATPFAPTAQPPNAEHPASAVLRFFLSPQPGYARAVGMPMLILTALGVIAGVTASIVIPSEMQWAHLAAVVLLPLALFVTFMVLHLRWVVTRKDNYRGTIAGPDQSGRGAIANVPAATRREAGLAELAAVCVGLGILVPILLYVFTQDLMLLRITLLGWQALAMLLGLLSYGRPLGRYAMLLAVVVIGAYSGVQLYDNYRKTPITYPWYGDTGFVETTDGPALSEYMRAKFGIPAKQVKKANRVFQDYYRQYEKLERKHTTYTRDADGTVHATIEPFADEMFELAKNLRAELGGIIPRAQLPPMPEKGMVHAQLGVFRWAGEARVKATLRRTVDHAGSAYHLREDVTWIDGARQGGNQFFESMRRDVSAFPERYRLYWIEPGNDGRTATVDGNSTTDRPKPSPIPAEVSYFDGHTAEVQDVVVTEDGRTIVSAGSDGKVIARDRSGKMLGTAVSPLAEKSPSIAWLSGLAVTTTGSEVYAGDAKGIWHAKIGDAGPLQRFINSADTVRFVTLYDQGNKLAYVDDTEIKFYDLPTQEILTGVPLRREGVQGYVHGATASPSGRHIAVNSVEKVKEGAENYRLTVYDAQDAGTVRLDSHYLSPAARAQSVFLNEQTLVVCLPEGRMRRWTFDADRWQLDPKTVRIPPGEFSAAAASRDGKIIYLANVQRIVGIDAATGKRLVAADLKVGRQLGNHISSWINALATTDNPHEVVAALWDGRVAVAKCVPYPESPPAVAVAGPASMIADKSQLPAAGQPGREDFAFVFKAPPGHVVSVWLELWENGKLTIPPECSAQYSSGRGKPLDATLRLATQEGKVVNPDLRGKFRVDWVLGEGKVDLAAARSVWLKSPEQPWKDGSTTYLNHYIAASRTNNPEWCEVTVGTTKRLYSLTIYDRSKATEAQKQRGDVFSIPDLMEGWPTAAIFVRARIDKADSIPGLPDDRQIRTQPNLGDRRFTPALSKLTRLAQELGAEVQDATDESEVRSALIDRLTASDQAREQAAALLKAKHIVAAADASADELAELLQESATSDQAR